MMGTHSERTLGFAVTLPWALTATTLGGDYLEMTLGNHEANDKTACLLEWKQRPQPRT